MLSIAIRSRDSFANGARSWLPRGVTPQPADPLLPPIGAYQGESRHEKIDVGVAAISAVRAGTDYRTGELVEAAS